MTATTAITTVVTSGHAATLAQVRRTGRGLGRALAVIGARWSDFVDAGQLGPAADTTISRHTGSRI